MIKKQNISLIIIALLSLALSACEDVIQLNLKDSAPRMVIDAGLNASTGTCEVSLTRSIDFYQADTVAAPVPGAAVELVDGSGAVRQLPELSPGLYSVTGIPVTAGETFKLNIAVTTGEKYTAQTIVPQDIRLDSLKVVRGFGDPRPSAPPTYQLNVKWQDPARVANYYRFVETRNGHKRRGSYDIYNDRQFDGTLVDMTLYRYRIEQGDTIHLEFQSIDSLSYAYYSQINDMARPSFVAATPYNPIGNFDNNALGNFGIYYTDIKDLIIKIGK